MDYIMEQHSTKKDRNVRFKLYYFFLGVVAFSTIGQYIIFKIAHMQFYLIEIYFIPFFMYSATKYKNIINSLIKKRISFFIMLYVILSGVFIGIFYTSDPVSVITMSRSLLYIVVLTFIFSEMDSYSIINLQIIVSGAIIGEFINALFLSNKDVSSLNSPAMALMIIIPIVRRKNIQFLLSSIFGIIVAINSGFRMSIISCVSAIFIGLVWMIFHRERQLNFRKIMGKMLTIVFVVALFVFIKDNFISLVNYLGEKLGMSSFAIFRVTTRLFGLLQLDFSASQDGERLDVFTKIVAGIYDRFLPRGLVGKSIDTLPLYIDAPITYLYDAFGSAGTFVVLPIVLYKGMKSFINSFFYITEIDTVCGLMFPIYMILLISNGSFLYITYQCILSGIVFGSWFKHKSYINSNNCIKN